MIEVTGDQKIVVPNIIRVQLFVHGETPHGGCLSMKLTTQEGIHALDRRTVDFIFGSGTYTKENEELAKMLFDEADGYYGFTDKG